MFRAGCGSFAARARVLPPVAFDAGAALVFSARLMDAVHAHSGG
jgi:hypothetical protein